MKENEFTCHMCENEFLVESRCEVFFCPHCGNDVVVDAEEEIDYDED
jgi:predicted RNA-binding Zn-ribbon protein involved in translation (DUF1610 family)